MGEKGIIFCDNSDYRDAIVYLEEVISEYTTTANDNAHIKRCVSTSRIPHIIVTGAIVFSSFGDLVAKNIIKENDSNLDEVAALAENISSSESQYLEEIKSVSFKQLNTNRNEVIKDILSFKSLENNWDGYGAVPLEIESAANAIALINFLDNVTVGVISDMSPNPNGTISILWKNMYDERLSVEIGNNTMSYYIKLNSQNPQFFNEIEITKDEAKLISNFVKSL